jgi:hypothetical protein
MWRFESPTSQTRRASITTGWISYAWPNGSLIALAAAPERFHGTKKNKGQGPKFVHERKK